MRMKRFFRWLPAVICMAVIFSFSAQNGETSGQVSSGIVDIIIDLIPPEIIEPDGSTEEFIHFLVRKTAHFSIYALLGSSYLFALWQYGIKPRFKAGLAVFLSFIYACTDEAHQAFVADRGPAFTDVLIDTSGACLAVGLVFLIVYIVKKRKNKKLSSEN